MRTEIAFETKRIPHAQPPRKRWKKPGTTTTFPPERRMPDEWRKCSSYWSAERLHGWPMMLTRSAGYGLAGQHLVNAMQKHGTLAHKFLTVVPDDAVRRRCFVCPGFFFIPAATAAAAAGLLFLSSRLFRHNKLAARPEWEKFKIISTKGIELTITQTKKNRSHRHSRTVADTQGRIAAVCASAQWPDPSRKRKNAFLLPRTFLFAAVFAAAAYVMRATLLAFTFFRLPHYLWVRSSRNAPTNPWKVHITNN